MLFRCRDAGCSIMPTFIDESADTCHARHSLAYFRLAAVFMPTTQATDSFREAIRQLCRDKGIEAGFEFKFANTHSLLDRRELFLSTALQHAFQFAVCAIDKTAP